MDGIKILPQIPEKKFLNQLGSKPTVTNIQRDTQTDFSKLLVDKINQVNELQKQSDQAISALAHGKTDDIASVMLAVEKADLALRLFMQIRNKVLEAYQDIMKTQI